MEESGKSFVRSYFNEGFSVAKAILPNSVLDAFLTEVNLIAIQQLAYVGSNTAQTGLMDLENNLAQLLACDPNAYLKGLRIAAKLNTLKSIVMHSSIESHARDLGLSLLINQTDPVFHVMGNSLRIPNGYMGFDAHQDWTALQGSLDLVVVWVPLVDVDKNRYPLEVIPRSHLYGLLPGTVTDHIYRIESDLIKEEAFVPVEVERGDVVFMNGFTVHRSGQSGGIEPRFACSTRFENAAEESYIARQYPFAQKRVIDRILIQDNFPDINLLENLFSKRIGNG